MLRQSDLKWLCEESVKDSLILFKARRYRYALYLSGFALELGLKYRICRHLGLKHGLPQHKDDLTKYRIKKMHSATGRIARKTLEKAGYKIGNFKTHDLSKLLKNSDLFLTITTDIDLSNKWQLINSWNNELRYKKQTISKNHVIQTIDAVNQILEIIF